MNIESLLQATKEILLITKGIAWSFVLLLFVMQIIFTLTKGMGGEKIDHVLSLKSLLVAACLLVFYDSMFEWLINISNDLIDQVIPSDFMKKFDKRLAEAIQRKESSINQQNFFVNIFLYGTTETISKWVLEAAVILMKASFIILRYLSNLAKNFLFIIGPLIIVTAIIPGASVVSGWVRAIIEVSLWPVVSGIFYRMLAAGMLARVDSRTLDDYFSFLAFCLILVFVNVFTPVLVNQLSNNRGVGGTATWAAGVLTYGAAKAINLSRKGRDLGKDYIQGKWNQNKERRPGDSA